MPTGPSASAEAARADRSARFGACLERARNGEPSALDEVVRELNPLLWRVARAEGLSASDASDVVQTVWLELVRRLHDIRSPQALTGWLVTTTRREAWRVASRARRHSAVGVESLDAAPDPGPESHEALITDERDRVLWRHFQRLSERCRHLLLVVAEADRPDYAAVSEALGMPHGSIGPTRGRCLAKLREMLLGDPAWTAA
jgi:RNA polymerase sigma factor (sigma-70 family)